MIWNISSLIQGSCCTERNGKTSQSILYVHAYIGEAWSHSCVSYAGPTMLINDAILTILSPNITKAVTTFHETAANS